MKWRSDRFTDVFQVIIRLAVLALAILMSLVIVLGDVTFQLAEVAVTQNLLAVS